MDDTTRNLLMKTRKGSTAQFGTKDWQTVLTEVGFGFEARKTGRTVTEVVVTSPLGEKLLIAKRSGYKHIVFYDLTDWLKTIGIDLVVSASVRLGMDTPDQERKLKGLYERDLTNTGTCPVCEGNFKRNGTGLVHHGYRRPGHGNIVGDCFAVGYLPWELSPIGAEEYVSKALVPALAREQAHLVKLKAGEITSFLKMNRYFGGKDKLPETVTRETNAYEFERMLATAIDNAEHMISSLEKEIVYFRNRVATWKADELPEVKYAGKFKAA